MSSQYGREGEGGGAGGGYRDTAHPRGNPGVELHGEGEVGERAEREDFELRTAQRIGKIR